MSKNFSKNNQNRLDYLHKLYDLSNKSVSLINAGEVAVQIGFKNGDENILIDIAKYLESEKLIEVNWIRGLPVTVKLTHLGLKKAEE